MDLRESHGPLLVNGTRRRLPNGEIPLKEIVPVAETVLEKRQPWDEKHYSKVKYSAA